ncbi:MAG: hypothetical protein IVW51_00695 [Thermaceae bacterium]|nr:hypothetical protein [Thermaceae bacterium]
MTRRAINRLGLITVFLIGMLAGGSWMAWWRGAAPSKNLVSLPSNAVLLPVYGLNARGLCGQRVLYLTIETKDDVQKGFAELLEKLLAEKFSSLPADLAFSQTAGKLVATVNLRNPEWAQGRDFYQQPWVKYFNMGTTGSVATELTLVETLLQPAFGGRWIDELRLRYEGKFGDLTDHGGLEEKYLRTVGRYQKGWFNCDPQAIP